MTSVCFTCIYFNQGFCSSFNQKVGNVSFCMRYHQGKTVSGHTMTKDQITQYLKAENHHAIFNLMASGISDLDLHDALYEHCTMLTQYYYIKAFKLVACEGSKENYRRFLDFCNASITSQHGHKAVLMNVISLYSEASSDLQYGHSEADGLTQLSKFVDIARKSF